MIRITQGFELPDGRHVAVFDNLGITEEVIRSAYPTLSDLAREHGLRVEHYKATSAVVFIEGSRLHPRKTNCATSLNK